jgi:hypothetical protein
MFMLGTPHRVIGTDGQRRKWCRRVGHPLVQRLPQHTQRRHENERPRTQVLGWYVPEAFDAYPGLTEYPFLPLFAAVRRV